MCKCEKYQEQIKKLKEQRDEAIECCFILIRHNHSNLMETED